MKIFKFPFAQDSQTTFELPKYSEVLTVQNQRGVPTLWAAVTDARETVKYKIHMLPTGYSEADLDTLKYISTAQFEELVFHFFEEIG